MAIGAVFSLTGIALRAETVRSPQGGCAKGAQPSRIALAAVNKAEGSDTLASRSSKKDLLGAAVHLPKRVSNPGLAALIQGAGFSSLERFAAAVNVRGWQMHGIKLSYDHVTVKRWLNGSVCQNPDVVVAVLSDAWGVPVPAQAIWPKLREGRAPIPAHLQPWSAARTLEELAAFIGSDMLTRREMLANSMGMAAGTALTEPIARWLSADVIGMELPARTTGKIGMDIVAGIEQATRYFMRSDAISGGGLSREAAVGQLKYAVDLTKYGSYTSTVGNRLLAAVADLSGWVGWMSHDVGMEGPAQQYLIFGLQAARESTSERAHVKVVGLLADLARQALSAGRPDTGLRLVDLAFDRLTHNGWRINKVRSLLWSVRAQMLAAMGSGYTAEARSAISLSFDLYGQISGEDAAPAIMACFPYTNDAELASGAAFSFRELARHDRTQAVEAGHQALYALDHRPSGFVRSRVFDQIELARARFLCGEPEQASVDGAKAADLAGQVPASTRVTASLQGLLTDSGPYKDHPQVEELREQLRTTLGS